MVIYVYTFHIPGYQQTSLNLESGRISFGAPKIMTKRTQIAYPRPPRMRYYIERNQRVVFYLSRWRGGRPEMTRARNINSPPMAPCSTNFSPPIVQAKAPAKTGSRAKISETLSGDVIF